MFGGKFFLNEIMVLILVQPKFPLMRGAMWLVAIDKFAF